MDWQKTVKIWEYKTVATEMLPEILTKFDEMYQL